MPRFGDGSARNVSEDKVKRAYVGGAALTGAGVAGGGLAVRNAGQRRLTSIAGNTSAIRADRAVVNRGIRDARADQGKTLDAVLRTTQRNPDIRRTSHNAVRLDRAVKHPSGPGVVNGTVVQARDQQRKLAALKGQVTRSRTKSDVAFSGTVRPLLRSHDQAAAAVRTGRAQSDSLTASLRAAYKGKTGAKAMVRGGKVALGVGAALPLAALATRNRVGNDWKANPRPVRESRGSKLAGRNVPRADRGGLSLKEHKAATTGDWNAFEAAKRRRNGL